eukprot:tig00021346_g20373.t1
MARLPAAVFGALCLALLAASAAAQAQRYIVVFKEGDAPLARASAEARRDRQERSMGTLHGLSLAAGLEKNVQVDYEYGNAVYGFAARMPEQLAQRLRENPEVAMVEEDKEVTINRPTGGGSTSPPPFPWNLDRVDSIERVYNSQYNVFADGTGVEVHVLDTGIRTTHSQFGGRAFEGLDAIGESRSCGGGLTSYDCNGHGTHCAGTVGGITFGAAKNVKLYGTKVLNKQGSGTGSSLLGGIDWVVQRKLNNPTVPMVMSMSLGFSGIYSPVDTAINNAVAAGIVAAVAAGNSNIDACGVSPAAATSAIAVGATDSSDNRASFSNYGPCVDIFAPGVNIPSAWYTSDTATNTISGTSMATPLVAGVFALYLSMNPGATPAEARAYVLGYAAKDKVINAVSTTVNDHIIFAAFPSPTPAPVGTTSTLAVAVGAAGSAPAAAASSPALSAGAIAGIAGAAVGAVALAAVAVAAVLLRRRRVAEKAAPTQNVCIA